LVAAKTEDGVKKLKDTCKRVADFKANAKKLGFEVKETYWAPQGKLVLLAC
jgi:uncharacterized protein with GYD domain